MSRSIIPDLKTRTVWFLTGSQGLYGEETLKQVAEQSQEVARVLGAASEVPVTIVWKPVLTDSAAIRRAVLDANADDFLTLIRTVATVWRRLAPCLHTAEGLEILRRVEW